MPGIHGLNQQQRLLSWLLIEDKYISIADSKGFLLWMRKKAITEELRANRELDEKIFLPAPLLLLFSRFLVISPPPPR